MSDDTRAPRQPFDDGPQPEEGGEIGEPREVQDAQEQLEAALARSRGIGEDGDVRSGEVLAGDDLAFDGRAEAPTDPALAHQEDVAVAFSDPLAADAADPNATVGLDRDELAAVLGHQPPASNADQGPAGADEEEAQQDDAPQDAESTEQAADVLSADVPSADVSSAEAPSADVPSTDAPTGDAADSGEVASETDNDAPSGYSYVPVVERVVAEEDDAADFPVTEPVPAQDLAADAIGAESVAAITVDASGSATAPGEEADAPRRTLEIDRTAARIASTSPVPPVMPDHEDAGTPDTERDAVDPAVDAADLAADELKETPAAEVVVTETVTEQLADDGETVEAVTVTERVEILDDEEHDALSTDDESQAPLPAASGLSDEPVEPAAGDLAQESSGVLVDGVSAQERDADGNEVDRAELGSIGTDGADAPPVAGGTSAASTDDDATFAPLRLSAPTDGDDLAPVKPKKRGNRMFAVFVALVASVVFAALYLLAFALLRTAFNTELEPIGEASEFAITAAFTVPVTVFAAFGVLWAVIVNRAGWWAYVLGGFIAAALVLAGYYVGAALQQHLADGLPIASIQLEEILAKFRASEHLLTALVAAIAAREAFTWVGGIAGARGRRVSRANRRAKLSYEKRMAERAAETAAASGSAE